MRVLLLCLIIAACNSPVAQEDRDPGQPEDQPFDSIATNCQPGDSVVNGQVQFICPSVYARPVNRTR